MDTNYTSSSSTELEEHATNNRGHKTTRDSNRKFVHGKDESRDENDRDRDDSEHNCTENEHRKRGGDEQDEEREDEESEDEEKEDEESKDEEREDEERYERGDEVAMSYHGRMRHRTEESLTLWKAEGEVQVLREKWASAMEMVDLLEKTNDELRVELQELRTKWNTYHPHELV